MNDQLDGGAEIDITTHRELERLAFAVAGANELLVSPEDDVREFRKGRHGGTMQRESRAHPAERS